tara:strand:+ start:300 stop:4298 length:3999 start_codon:yes stop_codon:yes gene_type:complete
MLVLASMMVSLSPAVSAVGPNQSDIGTSGGDLPDNLSSLTTIPNLVFSASVNGSGELYSSTDEYDYLRVSLGSNEGLAVELSFDSSDDFDLTIYDSTAQNVIDDSYMNNPETVTTNGSTHGGMVYIEIYGYLFSSNSNWSYNLTIWKFTTSSTGGGNGSSVTNCTGAGTVTQDILEPNDSTTTATSASLLPLTCTGLSIHTSTDVDYFEIDMTAGVTYYVNVTLNHISGDLDTGWDTATGGFLDSSGSTSNVEYMQVTATANQTTYVDVYGWSGATNTYDIEITTDNPGGGQSSQFVDVNIINTTHATLLFSGLTSGTTYNYNHTYGQIHLDDDEHWGPSSNGTFNATNSTHSVNISIAATNNESSLLVSSTLFDASGAALNTDMDALYIEMVEIEATSSTTGDIELTNLSIGTDYVVEWAVLDYVEWANNFTVSNDVNAAVNHSMIDSDMWYLTPTNTSTSYQINWTGPTTMNEHLFLAYIAINGTTVNLSNNDNFSGLHFYDFIPQLPTLVIAAYSASSASSTNNVQAEGLDLVVGDAYQYQYRVTDASNANLATSSMTGFTATAQNMSLPSFTYSTPNASGTYCVHVDLYSNLSVQLIGDSDCFNLVQDDDGDGVPNESDLCPSTTAGSMVDQYGCALSQRDTDGDGYNDDVDAFPSDATQWSDMDGDGYGDNASGNMADDFPNDASQWSDMDGDGYGDNANGTYPDAFPTDPTQWSDADGDGYGDNASGNNPDAWPSDSSQWADSDGDGFGDNSSGTNGDAFPNDVSQWSDADGDGYGDNPNGTTPDQFPADGTQWEDADGDGYGDNPQGNNADKFPSDASQWFDSDDDGYGDNQAGTSPDAFPNDSTQWADSDGDGYGNNAAGLNADAFPNDPTQWRDADGDGYGDNANGNSPDLCLDTPAGEAVDVNGCSASQLDADMDGVSDANDACPDTPAGETVDNVGCSSSQEDADNDGVMDAFDACANTPLGAIVDAAGCAASQLDSDGDTINDDRDECPTTTTGEPVNGVGCAASERDSDDDGVVDASDVCDNTPFSENADIQGCSPSQKDSDGDGVTDHIDNCPGTENGLNVDMLGCATNQRDADSDGVSDADDTCPATPKGEQVDPTGCSDSQKDADQDEIMNNKDLCPDTPTTQRVDIDGCSEQQKDDDTDGIKNHLDECPNTPEGELIDVVGCALVQLDSDGDGVNDAEDAFKFDANESVDTDNDGVADRWDAYPEDATRSQAEVEESGNGLLYAVIALLLIGLLGGGGYFYTRKPELTTSGPFDEMMDSLDAATEENMGDGKEIPVLEESETQQWEEDGVHWSREANGQLSYYDASSEQWLPYEG